MKKPGRARLIELCREASRETGLPFSVETISVGNHKGTVQYRYCIVRGGAYPGPVTSEGSPAQVERAFRVLLDRFRNARTTSVANA